MIGIYKITNKINNKVYIGESMDIKKRWQVHQEDLIRDQHHSYKLQKDYNKYGNVFDYEIIENPPDDADSYKCMCYLIYKEDLYIKRYKSVEKGYNCEYTLDKILSGERNISSNVYMDINMLKSILLQGEKYCLYKKDDPRYVEFKFDYSSIYDKIMDLFELYIDTYDCRKEYISKVFTEFELFQPAKCNFILKRLKIINDNNLILKQGVGFYNTEEVSCGKYRVVVDKDGLLYLLKCLRSKKDIKVLNSKIKYLDL